MIVICWVSSPNGLGGTGPLGFHLFLRRLGGGHTVTNTSSLCPSLSSNPRRTSIQSVPKMVLFGFMDGYGCFWIFRGYGEGGRDGGRVLVYADGLHSTRITTTEILSPTAPMRSTVFRLARSTSVAARACVSAVAVIASPITSLTSA
jgi:hypothetical protein